MREVLHEASAYAKKPLLQCPRLHESLKYIYEFVFGRVRKVDVYVIRGLTEGSSGRMTMLYAGTESSAHQLASLIYAKIDEFLHVGSTLLHEANMLPLIRTAEIFAFEVQRHSVQEFSRRGYLILPNVNFILDMRLPIDSIIKRMSRRRRRDIKKINSLDYSYEICRGSDRDFDFFYHKMYLPYARSRFGKGAYIKPYLESKTVYRSNGGIIFVKKSHKPLAGMLFRVHKKTLFAWSLGAHEGDQQLIEELAGEAALLFLVEWAKTQGVEKLDYGVSLPFLREGIFSYKREWGMTVNEQRDNSVCALKVNLVNQCSLTFLQQNPFIVVDRGELKGVVFVDYKATSAELQQISSRFYLPNLDSLMVISYYRITPETTVTAEPATGKKLVDDLAGPLQSICQVLREKGFSVEAFQI